MALNMGKTAKIAEIMGDFTHAKEIQKLFTARFVKAQPLQLFEYVPVRLPEEVGVNQLRGAEVRPQRAETKGAFCPDSELISVGTSVPGNLCNCYVCPDFHKA